MTKTSIYNIPEEVQKAIDRYYDCFDEETGELIKDEAYMEAAAKHLEEMQNRSDDLLIWYVQDLQNRKLRVDMIDAEIERMKMQKKREEKQVERSEMLVTRLFEKVYRGKALNVGTFTLNFKETKSVGEIPNAIVPEQYRRYPVKSIEIRKGDLPGEIPEEEKEKKIHVVIEEGEIDKIKVMAELKQIEEEIEALPEEEKEKTRELKEVEKFAFIAKKKKLNIK